MSEEVSLGTIGAELRLPLEAFTSDISGATKMIRGLQEEFEALTFDPAGVTAGIGRMQDRFTSLRRSIGLTQESLDKITWNPAGVEAGADKAASAMAGVEGITRDLHTAFDRIIWDGAGVERGAATADSALSEVEGGARALRASLAGIILDPAGIVSGTDEAKAGVSSLSRSITGLRTRVETPMALDPAGIVAGADAGKAAVAGLGAEVAAVKREMGSGMVMRPSAGFGGGRGGVISGTERANGYRGGYAPVRRPPSISERMGPGMSMAGNLAMIPTIGALITGGMDIGFENLLQAQAANSNMGAADMPRLRAEVLREMRLGIPEDKAAPAYRHIYDYQYRGSETRPIMKSVAEFGLGTQTPVDEIAPVVGRSMRNFNMHPDDADKVVNALHNAMAFTDVTARQIVNNVSKTLGRASTYTPTPRGYAEGLALWGTLAHRMSPSRADTQADQIYAQIAAPTPKALEAAQKMGLGDKFSVGGIQKYNISGVIGAIREKILALPLNERAPAIKSLFPNKQGGFGMTILTGPSGASLYNTGLNSPTQGTLAGISGKTKFVESFAAAQMQQPAQRIAAAKGQLRADAIETGRKSAGDVADIVSAGAKVARELLKVLDAFLKFPKPIRDAVYALGAMRLAALAFETTVGFGAITGTGERGRMFVSMFRRRGLAAGAAAAAEGVADVVGARRAGSALSAAEAAAETGIGAFGIGQVIPARAAGAALSAEQSGIGIGSVIPARAAGAALGVAGAAEGVAGAGAAESAVGGVAAAGGVAFAPLTAGIAAVVAAAAGLWKAWQTDFGGIREVTAKVVASVSGWVKQIAPLVQTTLHNLETGWKAHSGRLLAVVTPLWRMIGTVVTGAINLVGGVIKVGLNLINGNWSGAWSAFKQLLVNVWGAVKGIVSNGVKMVGNLIAGITEIAIQLAGKFATSFASLGKAIIDGITGGIRHGVGSVVSAVKNLAQNVISTAKTVLHSHSPSLVFHQIGLDIGAGLQNGIREASPRVRAEMERMMAEMRSVADPKLERAIIGSDETHLLAGLPKKDKRDRVAIKDWAGAQRLLLTERSDKARAAKHAADSERSQAAAIQRIIDAANLSAAGKQDDVYDRAVAEAGARKSERMDELHGRLPDGKLPPELAARRDAAVKAIQAEYDAAIAEAKDAKAKRDARIAAEAQRTQDVAKADMYKAGQLPKADYESYLTEQLANPNLDPEGLRASKLQESLSRLHEASAVLREINSEIYAATPKTDLEEKLDAWSQKMDDLRAKVEGMRDSLGGTPPVLNMLGTDKDFAGNLGAFRAALGAYEGSDFVKAMTGIDTLDATGRKRITDANDKATAETKRQDYSSRVNAEATDYDMGPASGQSLAAFQQAHLVKLKAFAEEAKGLDDTGQLARSAAKAVQDFVERMKADQAEKFREALDRGDITLRQYRADLVALQAQLPQTSEEFRRLGKEIGEIDRRKLDQLKGEIRSVSDEFGGIVANSVVDHKNFGDQLKDMLKERAKQVISHAVSDLVSGVGRAILIPRRRTADGSDQTADSGTGAGSGGGKDTAGDVAAGAGTVGSLLSGSGGSAGDAGQAAQGIGAIAGLFSKKDSPGGGGPGPHVGTMYVNRLIVQGRGGSAASTGGGAGSGIAGLSQLSSIVGINPAAGQPAGTEGPGGDPTGGAGGAGGLGQIAQMLKPSLSKLFTAQNGGYAAAAYGAYNIAHKHGKHRLFATIGGILGAAGGFVLGGPMGAEYGFGAGSYLGGQLAKGGPASAGKTYLTGEERPEPFLSNSGRLTILGLHGPQLFRPTESGTVFPNYGALANRMRGLEIAPALRLSAPEIPESFRSGASGGSSDGGSAASSAPASQSGHTISVTHIGDNHGREDWESMEHDMAWHISQQLTGPAYPGS